MYITTDKTATTTMAPNVSNPIIIDELTDIPTVIDPFCERRFWENDRHIKLPITNPVSAGTGLVIMLMAMFTTNIRKPDTLRTTRESVTTFYLCRASLGIVGAGTVVFHSMDDTMAEFKDLNFRMCDWLPIVLMCTNIVVLYITKFERDANECCLTTAFICMYIWTCVLVLAVDSNTYEHLTLKWHDPDSPQSIYGTLMNVVLLVPLGLTLATASYYHFPTRSSLYIWSCVAVNLALWIANAYACSDTLWLSMLHALYHVTIAYTFLCAACLGMTIDGAWKVEFVRYVWPMIVPADGAVNNILYTNPRTKKEALDMMDELVQAARNLDAGFTPSLTNIRIENIKST
jgi:hypothetical protein